MREHVDLQRGREIRGDLVCILCARTVGSAQGKPDQPLTTATIQALDAGHSDSVLRLRCPHCLGRLWLQNSEEVDGRRPSTSREELRPRRGRPPKVRRAS